jgi:hypothetical protein
MATWFTITFEGEPTEADFERVADLARDGFTSGQLVNEPDAEPAAAMPFPPARPVLAGPVPPRRNCGDYHSGECTSEPPYTTRSY